MHPRQYLISSNATRQGQLVYLQMSLFMIRCHTVMSGVSYIAGLIIQHMSQYKRIPSSLCSCSWLCKPSLQLLTSYTSLSSRRAGNTYLTYKGIYFRRADCRARHWMCVDQKPSSTKALTGFITQAVFNRLRTVETSFLNLRRQQSSHDFSFVLYSR
jgi:hypothetical protein